MSTRIHQTWDLGNWGELTLDISHCEPLPVSAFPILANLATDLYAHVSALRALLSKDVDQ